MNATAMRHRRYTPYLSLLLGTAVAVMALLLLLRVLNDARAVFVALSFIGLLGMGIGLHKLGRVPWWNPFTLAAMLLGGLIIGLMATVLLNLRVLLLADDYSAALVLAGLLLLKLGLVTARELTSG